MLLAPIRIELEFQPSSQPFQIGSISIHQLAKVNASVEAHRLGIARWVMGACEHPLMGCSLLLF